MVLSYQAAVSPGRVSICDAGAAAARTTTTGAGAIASACAASAALRVRLATTKPISSATAMTAAAICSRLPVMAALSGWGKGSLPLRGTPRATAQQAVHGGNEDQGREGCEDQAADHRAAQRRVLFAALADTERHRDHADDHGAGG